MKDLLSEVLKRKRFCFENCSTNEEVLTVFQGLLTVLGKVKKQNNSELLASVLSFAIMAEANAIAESNSLHETDIGEVEAGTGKSGKLDKVGDDCLRLSIGFLSAKDRMENIELTCRRLFHSSRSAPYGISRFDKAVKLFRVPESRLVDFARRMQCEHFKSIDNHLGDVCTSQLRKCVKMQRRQLTYLGIDENLGSLLQSSFPRLDTVYVPTLPVSQLHVFYAFLLRHTSLQKICTDMPLSTELLTTACKCPNVCSLSVDCVETDFTVAAENCNVKKVTTFCVDHCNDFGLIEPFLHSGTQVLSVWGYTDTTMYNEPLELPKLRALSLGLRGVPLRDLYLKPSQKLKNIYCHAYLLDLDECLRLCPFGAVTLCAHIQGISALQVSLLRSRLMDVFTDKRNFKHESLRLRIKEPMADRHLVAMREFASFFIVAQHFIAPTTVRFEVPRIVNEYLIYTLGQEVVDNLKDAVKYRVY